MSAVRNCFDRYGFVRDFVLLETGLDPLTILSEKSFRPVFAEQDNATEGKRYVKMIGRVRAVWELEQFAFGSLE